jgi:hypothetical protein
MSRFRTEITLPLSRDAAYRICRAAIEDLGWVVTSEGEARITGQEAVRLVSAAINPVRVAVGLTDHEEGCTDVTVNGANFGSSVPQSTHVRQCVDLLIGAIEEGGARFRCEHGMPRGVNEPHPLVDTSSDKEAGFFGAVEAAPGTGLEGPFDFIQARVARMSR